jgi:hypothetical protein
MKSERTANMSKSKFFYTCVRAEASLTEEGKPFAFIKCVGVTRDMFIREHREADANYDTPELDYALLINGYSLLSATVYEKKEILEEFKRIAYAAGLPL